MPRNFDPDGDDGIKLFTPGPVHVPDRVRSELAKPNDTHRSNPYYQLHSSVRARMKEFLHTENDVLIFTSSGTGVMEACARNLVADGETVLVLSCGAFGDRWASIAASNGKKVEHVKVEWGRAVDPGLVGEKLDSGDYPVVFVQFNETSTGVVNPLGDIARVVKEHGSLLCVDAVSGMGGMELDVDQLGIDVCLASTQKCFALPPGLAVASVSAAAYEKAGKVENRGQYFDLLTLKKYGDKDQTPTTPPIPIIRALNAQLDHILHVEGLENRFKRHAEIGENVRAWAQEQGFRMFSEEGHHSNTVACIEWPGSPEAIQGLVDALEDAGYRIVNGYGGLRGKTFRIGFMGALTVADVGELLEKISELLPKFK
ncbi:MAG: pyridoxal-phosphate-dependent aminotransferase family protein [Promethearchaeota archaeon]